MQRRLFCSLPFAKYHVLWKQALSLGLAVVYIIRTGTINSSVYGSVNINFTLGSSNAFNIVTDISAGCDFGKSLSMGKWMDMCLATKASLHLLFIQSWVVHNRKSLWFMGGFTNTKYHCIQVHHNCICSHCYNCYDYEHLPCLSPICHIGLSETRGILCYSDQECTKVARSLHWLLSMG